MLQCNSIVLEMEIWASWRHSPLASVVDVLPALMPKYLQRVIRYKYILYATYTSSLLPSHSMHGQKLHPQAPPPCLRFTVWYFFSLAQCFKRRGGYRGFLMFME
ncbi:hypothetical protein GDO81_022521 [Engystomops pustulosus]|uniref:Uncharacterized protein n=1 Tax=Engystomops pustulosus TaxID=76066 RepID=A0AAV6Z5J6_ENGPU|nr:hypothetical protein GDO81_022521 [Engystomops pustulosus]